MTVVSTISHEVGESESAFARVHLDVVRTGVGSGPNALLNIDLDGVDLYSSLMRFPVIGRTTVADEVILVTLMVSAPPGTRWCEIDIGPGDVLVYGPGSKHSSVNPEGVEYRSALIDQSALDEVADSLQAAVHHPARGSVTLLNPTAAAREFASKLYELGSPLAPSDDLPATSDGVLRAAANALAGASGADRSRQTRAIHSSDVVHECVEYADSIGRSPTIAELCLVTHVSERRLRAAFHDTFNVSPNVFLRTRRLSRVRDLLLTGDQSVTEVALDLGFDHLGRFAAQYARAYREHPRDTLMQARSTGIPAARRTTARTTAPRVAPSPA